MLRGLALAVALAGFVGAPAWGEDPAPPDPAVKAAAEAKAVEQARAALVALVQRVRSAIVPVEVRAPDGARTRRQAVVVDASGWLVMAGPVPSPRDSLIAVLGKDASPLQVVGTDAETALTLVQLLAPTSALQVLTLPDVPPRRPLPTPPLPGAAVLMVTADAAVARGALRATDRLRHMADITRGVRQPVSGLLEASLATVAADLGSPWFDAEGRLMGLLVGGIVDDAGAGRAATPEGISLRPEPVAAHAVPAAVIALVWPLLRTDRSVRRARLGLRTEIPSEAVLAQLCPSCGGYAVLAVEPGGPAAQAGIEVHDLVSAIEGVPLRRQVTFQDALLPFRPLDPVTLTVVRRGSRHDLRVVLGAR